MKIKIVALAVIILTAFGCKSAKQLPGTMANEKESVRLSDITWELSKLNGEDIDQSGLSKEKIYFSFNALDHTVAGYSGCNYFNGTYMADDNGGLSFSKMASTRMACYDTVVEESQLFAAFELTKKVSASGGKLVLKNATNGVVAEFTKSKSGDTAITEKYWKLKELAGDEVVMAENQEREIYFILKTNENLITGFSGCNMFSGQYTMESENQIRFEQLATTMKICPDVAVNESEILAVFNTALNYNVSGDVLRLNNGEGDLLAVFEAIYF